MKYLIVLYSTFVLSFLMYGLGSYSAKAELEPQFNKIKVELNKCEINLAYAEPFVDYCTIQIGIQTLTADQCLRDLNYCIAFMEDDDYQP